MSNVRRFPPSHIRVYQDNKFFMMTRAYSGIAGLFVVAFAIPLLTIAAVAQSQPKAVVQKPIASCVQGKPQVTLSWSKPTGATSYSIFRNKKTSTTWTTLSSKQLGRTFVDATTTSGTTYQYQVKTYFGTLISYSNIVNVAVPSCATTTPPSTPTTPTSETTFGAYITGYGWPDNTPPSAEISDGVIHTEASGTGTYTDPITVAVGHSIIDRKDILDYPKGTKFYIPAFRKYFIVEDTCGDGNSPQNGPCHTGYQGHVWLDVWVGGNGANSSSVLSCEDKITGIHTVIQNPASNYSVTTGPIFSGVCISLLGETIIKI